ncbi:hypothetical protein CBS101457_004530 [Exobasidium rhododendri]|nr:hypothetical protein CBS101457_004530 [Exobasidium rhododendri]
MIASVSQQSRLQEGTSDMAMSGLESIANEGGFPAVSSVATSPPPFRSDNNTDGNLLRANSSHNSTDSHQFNIETFDFGADFALPSSLDELSIFQNQHHNNSGTGPNSTSSNSASGPLSNDEVLGSPKNIGSSPRLTSHKQRSHIGSGSRNESPHPLSMGTSDMSSLTGEGNASTINNADLHDLLMAVQTSSFPPQQAHNFQLHQSPQALQESKGLAQEGTMSISDLERMLTDKEQSERMQNMQTAFLRQQIESLRRQEQHPERTRSRQMSASTTPNINATHLMQQFQQLSSQQSTPAPTSQNHLYAPFSQHQEQQQQQQEQQHQQHHQQQSTSSAGYPSQPQKIDLSSMTQYGLVTPLSSGAFSHQGNQAFVSPIHLPTSSQAGVMEAYRAYDPHMMNGSYTPLESPAITPASVFSTVGSSTLTNQDMFSPLTSPALRPQMSNLNDEMMLPPSASPYFGPTMTRGRASRVVKGKSSPHLGPQGKKTTTPNASPLTNPTKSIPRKNRSTTAEARANRARPSPIVKATTSTAVSSTSSRKRTGSVISTNGFPSPLGHKITNDVRMTGPEEGKQDQSTFAPLTSLSGPTKPMDASPSDTAASTPSPIDLNGSAQGKPITPSSLMGILPGDKGRSSNQIDGKAKEIENSKQVSFAMHHPQQQQKASSSQNGSSSSPTSLQNIQPGGFPAADREAWMMVKSGGGLESRRTSHKAAEQKRRDSLKYCFDELRGMLPAITLDDDAPGGSSLGPDGLPEDQEEEEFNMEEVGDAESARIANRAISKVALLRHSNEYLIRLKYRLARRDADLEYCRAQVMELQSRLGYPLGSSEAAMLPNHTPMHVDGSLYDPNSLTNNDMDAT